MTTETDKKNLDEYCSFRLPERELQKLNRVAKTRGIKRSRLIRDVLSTYLEKSAA
jgi:metal-responsive CopG/Arc/MetJ family transcriptional regulator